MVIRTADWRIEIPGRESFRNRSCARGPSTSRTAIEGYIAATIRITAMQTSDMSCGRLCEFGGGVRAGRCSKAAFFASVPELHSGPGRGEARLIDMAFVDREEMP